MKTNLLVGFFLFTLLFSEAQTTWYKYPGNPVVQPGEKGEWDLVKIAHTVLYEDGRYHMWYKGWSYAPGSLGIGYASSPDGIQWQKYEGNPLEFTCEETSWDTVFLAFDIIKKDSIYRMWYAARDRESNSGVGVAWSDDGLNWTKHHEPVLRPGREDEWDAADIKAATVCFDGIRYHMWYNGIESGDPRVQRIGYATSDDGFTWEKHPSNPVLDVGGAGTWDEYSIGTYSINFNGSFYEMWYDGSDKISTQTGYATSVDGVNWIKSSDNPVLRIGVLGTFDTWITRIPTVVSHDSIYRMWYYGHDYTRGTIGYATASVDEAKAWDTATLNKPQRVFKVQVFTRLEYINVDSLLGIMPEVSGKELIDACNKLALAFSLNDSKKSLAFAEKALRLSDKENYPEGRAMALSGIGNIHYILDNYSAALASQLSALWLFDSLDMHFEHGNLLCQIAGIHSYAGSHDLSCRYFKQAVDAFENLQDTLGIIISLRYLGISYLEYGDTASAINAFQRSLSLAEKSRRKWIEIETYEYVGLCYSGRNLDSALWYFNKAYKLWNNAWPSGFTLLNKAEAYAAAGPKYYNDAESYFQKCFPLFEAAKSHKVRLYLNAAELFFMRGKYGRSRKLLDIALKECQILLAKQDYTMYASLQEKLKVDIDLRSYMEKIYRLYYRLDTVYRDKNSAFTHYVLASQWEDSIYNEQGRKKMAMMQGAFETESTQNRMDMLRKENEVKDLQIRQSRIILSGMGVILVFVVLGAYMFIRQRKIRAQHALELEQVESEKLKELDHMKSRFFADISHEFRTPLTLIMRPLEKLLSKSYDETDKKDLAIARKYAQSLQNLINNLLTLSRLESGKMQLHASEINIVKLIKGYFQAFESLAMQKDIELEFTSENKEIPIWIDQEKFEQILNNLLSNAFKFTPEGGRVSIEVSSRQWAAGTTSRLMILVSNTGTGIPPEHIDHVFDRFFQVNDPSRSYSEGTGIGLALTKELVELHHGHITVESKVGEGTSFTIALPLGKDHLKTDEIIEQIKKPDIEIRTEAKRSPAEPKPKIDSIKEEQPSSVIPPPLSFVDDALPLLLIAEDNPDMLNYIREYFENDFQIIEAADGLDGYKKAIEQIPDFIVSDVMMPGMDGNEFCSKLKSDERTSHIPVILLTARASREDRIEGLGTGADDFITKPFDGEELQIRVKNLFEQRHRIRKRLERIIQKSTGIVQIDFEDNDITSMDAQFLQKVIEIVRERHPDTQFNANAFGRAVGLGRIQMNRKIKALTGQTTVGFIRSYRLNRAAELLKKRSGTVAEIAYDVGFSSPSYFSECFKLHFGKLPSEYTGDDSE